MCSDVNTFKVTLMLKCSASLWSADLANLGAEIRRVEAYTERFHLDVADGHYVPSMLFFPDLVKALRKHTEKPFEVHLMTTEPLAWVEPFVEAGADGVIFCFDSLKDPAAAIKTVKDLGKFVAISLLGHGTGELARAVLGADRPGYDRGDADGDERDIDAAGDFRQDSRGAGGDSKTGCEGRDPARWRHPRNTVPQIAEAGGNWIVPGSLMFGEEPGAMRTMVLSILDFRF